MKRTGLFLTALLAGLTLFTSCGGDDDDVLDAPLDTPAYENVSAKYVISGAPSIYESFELTASGNYVIVKRGGVPLGARKFFGRMDEATRATSYGNIIYGKFTKKSDTEFELEGFGTIVIEGSSSNVVSLKITPKGESTVTLPAQRVDAIESAPDSFTSNICRTWEVASYRYTVVLDGDVIFDGEYKTFAELGKALTAKAKSMGYDVDSEDITDYDDKNAPDQVIFSKSGTYIVLYKNSSLAVSTWKWVDESKGVLHYSWDYDNPYAKDVSGDAHLSWRGSQLVVTEESKPDPEDMEEGMEGSEIKMVTYLNEVK